MIWAAPITANIATPHGLRPLFSFEVADNLVDWVNKNNFTSREILEHVFCRNMFSPGDTVDFLITLVNDKSLDGSTMREESRYDKAARRYLAYRILSLSKFKDDPRVINLHIDKLTDKSEKFIIRREANMWLDQKSKDPNLTEEDALKILKASRTAHQESQKYPQGDEDFESIYKDARYRLCRLMDRFPQLLVEKFVVDYPSDV